MCEQYITSAQVDSLLRSINLICQKLMIEILHLGTEQLFRDVY